MRRVMGLIALLLSMPATAQTKVEAKTATLDFSYTYPAAAARVAPLRRWLEADRAWLRTRTAKMAAADRREAAKSDFPFHRHDATREWKVVTETPRLLSLSGESYSFTGGAHGNTVLEPLVWDKAKARRIDPRAMFESPSAMQRVFGAGWCAWLKGERRRRFGNDPGADDIFPCPPVSDLTVLLGSTDRRAIDRIGLVAGQYVAGSYAEGMYEMTVPVTPAVLALVRPEWRGAFATK
ncbi:hypothetical protein FHS97_003224 [Sphingomonas endophytica]|uniref:Deacetylase PdaC domain-containing protein n=1 Tax=Sphingomonas endophytica TaxID=869719 RepID=A0ABR6N9R4_9SPHN|nr:DUF4163 domain-containing protein [Sphingomonas endophytica]MBB5727269.1 hypothetical protein [Sphingomonas endophytica]